MLQTTSGMCLRLLSQEPEIRLKAHIVLMALFLSLPIKLLQIGAIADCVN